MATFLVNDTSGAVTARITPSGAGRDLVVIDDCGSNCSFMYRAPRRKVTDHSVEVARNYCGKCSNIQYSSGIQDLIADDQIFCLFPVRLAHEGGRGNEVRLE